MTLPKSSASISSHEHDTTVHICTRFRRIVRFLKLDKAKPSLLSRSRVQRDGHFLHLTKGNERCKKDLFVHFFVESSYR